MANTIQWKRLLLEGGAIVVSILLAFAIDAWWGEHQQLQSDREHLRSVYDELAIHKILFAEAAAAHQQSMEFGTRLIQIISDADAAAANAEFTDLVNGMFNFYVINAPFGSLNTAMSSGAIARMDNARLGSRLASWPTAIEDLKEEQLTGSRLVAFQLLPALSARMSLAGPYRLRLAAPNVRGTSTVATVLAHELPESPHQFDAGPLIRDRAVENEFLQVMMWAHSSLAELSVFDGQLEALMSELAACLESSSC